MIHMLLAVLTEYCETCGKSVRVARYSREGSLVRKIRACGHGLDDDEKADAEYDHSEQL